MIVPAPVPTAKTVLFTEYAEEWLKIKQQTTKSSTFKEYERSYRVDLAAAFKGKYLRTLQERSYRITCSLS